MFVKFKKSDNCQSTKDKAEKKPDPKEQTDKADFNRMLEENKKKGAAKCAVCPQTPPPRQAKKEPPVTNQPPLKEGGKHVESVERNAKVSDDTGGADEAAFTTKVISEEGGKDQTFTTMMLGEEGGHQFGPMPLSSDEDMTTAALGEEGGLEVTPDQFHRAMIMSMVDDGDDEEEEDEDEIQIPGITTMVIAEEGGIGSLGA